MTAKEMFEKLGYEKEEVQETTNGVLTHHFIKFSKYEDYTEYEYHYYFNLLQKSYMFNFVAEFKISESYTQLEELKAITQQMKELGWIE